MIRLRPVAAMTSVAAVTFVVLVAAACVPRQTGESVAVAEGSRSGASKPPVMPADPNPEIMVDAVSFDLTNRPEDQDYWSPRRSEGMCAAKKIVDGVGYQRLGELGFQPDTPGAGLPDIAFTKDERKTVLDALVSCVDTEEAAAALIFGAGRVSSQSAVCYARIIDKAGAVPDFFESWLFGTPVDPFANDGRLADTMAAGAQVCLNPTSLNWPTLHSPIAQRPVIDANAPAGSSNSNRPDDQRIKDHRSKKEDPPVNEEKN